MSNFRQKAMAAIILASVGGLIVKKTNESDPWAKKAILSICVTKQGKKKDYYSCGTAFVADGRLITATHVVEPVEKLKEISLCIPAKTSDDDTPYECIDISSKHFKVTVFDGDISEIVFDDPIFLPAFLDQTELEEFEISDRPPKKGEKVTAIGLNYWREDLTGKKAGLWHTTGRHTKDGLDKLYEKINNKVLAKIKPNMAGKMHKTSALNVMPGNSGGPLVLTNEPSKAIGVCSNSQLPFFPRNKAWFGDLTQLKKAKPEAVQNKLATPAEAAG